MTIDLERLRDDYATKGFADVEDIANPARAEALLALLRAADYDRIEQTRRSHYAHVFANGGRQHPAAGEVYLSRFSRAASVERNPLLTGLIDDWIRPALTQISGVVCDGAFELRAYRMDAGDLIRAHSDDYAARIGFVYYLCRNWKLDWGGLLHVVGADEIRTSVPGFNRLVAINHGMRLVHFVSAIADYAKSPRYTIVGLLP